MPALFLHLSKGFEPIDCSQHGKVVFIVVTDTFLSLGYIFQAVDDRDASISAASRTL
jgi:hypothetical protein